MLSQIGAVFVPQSLQRFAARTPTPGTIPPRRSSLLPAPRAAAATREIAAAGNPRCSDSTLRLAGLGCRFSAAAVFEAPLRAVTEEHTARINFDPEPSFAKEAQLPYCIGD
jgi:hypothetical protein